MVMICASIVVHDTLFYYAIGQITSKVTTLMLTLGEYDCTLGINIDIY